MRTRLLLYWYHGRLGLSWGSVVPPLALIGTITTLSLMTPRGERGHDLFVALEGGMPMVAAFLAAPLLMSERERMTLWWSATRTSLVGIVVARLVVLSLYLLACCGVTLLVAGMLWHTTLSWEPLMRGGTRALTFAGIALLASSWGRAPVYGYIASAALWLGVLMFGALVPQREPWLTFNPFAWSAGYDSHVVAHSMIVYAALGLGLLLLQRPLLRPERLLRRA